MRSPKCIILSTLQQHRRQVPGHTLAKVKRGSRNTGQVLRIGSQGDFGINGDVSMKFRLPLEGQIQALKTISTQ